nr:ABC transporter permease subunit [Gluconobacter cerinus]
MSQLPGLGRLLYPALVTSQTIPIVGIAAPLVIIFGFGMTPKLIIVAWIVFFPVVVNMMDGLAHIDRDQINLARLLGATRLRTFSTYACQPVWDSFFPALRSALLTL